MKSELGTYRRGVEEIDPEIREPLILGSQPERRESFSEPHRYLRWEGEIAGRPAIVLLAAERREGHERVVEVRLVADDIEASSYLLLYALDALCHYNGLGCPRPAGDDLAWLLGRPAQP